MRCREEAPGGVFIMGEWVSPDINEYVKPPIASLASRTQHRLGLRRGGLSYKNYSNVKKPDIECRATPATAR